MAGLHPRVVTVLHEAAPYFEPDRLRTVAQTIQTWTLDAVAVFAQLQQLENTVHLEFAAISRDAWFCDVTAPPDADAITTLAPFDSVNGLQVIGGFSGAMTVHVILSGADMMTYIATTGPAIDALTSFVIELRQRVRSPRSR